MKTLENGYKESFAEVAKIFRTLTVKKVVHLFEEFNTKY